MFKTQVGGNKMEGEFINNNFDGSSSGDFQKLGISLLGRFNPIYLEFLSQVVSCWQYIDREKESLCLSPSKDTNEHISV